MQGKFMTHVVEFTKPKNDVAYIQTVQFQIDSLSFECSGSITL